MPEPDAPHERALPEQTAGEQPAAEQAAAEHTLAEQPAAEHVEGEQSGADATQPRERTPHDQTMKPATAAKKLGILLDAAPESFREGEVTRSEYAALQADPPEWLATLRREGPHPRPVVAAKLGVSISGLARGGVAEALTTEQISELLRTKPAWLVQERETHAAVMAENARVKRERAAKARTAR